MFLTEGKLRYSENLPGHDKWWLVADCCPSIIKYYEWLVHREIHEKINLPKFGSHITVISGEEPEDNKDQWNKYNGENVQIEIGKLYSIEAKQEGKSKIFCLEANSPKFLELRKFFGLKMEYPFHLTIGWY